MKTQLSIANHGDALLLPKNEDEAVNGKDHSETESCSSAAEDMSECDGEHGNEADDDDYSFYSTDSDESSLGEEIRRAEAAGTFSMERVTLMEEQRRSRSLPNVMAMMVGPSDNTNDGTVTSPEQQQALTAFMARMNSSASYFQDPRAQPRQNANTNPRPSGTAVRASKSSGALQDLVKNTTSKDRMSPHVRLQEILKHNRKPQDDDDAMWDSYFLPIDDARVNAYTPPVVAAMRGQDLAKLRQTVEEQGPASMEACNRQGETLLHLACRRRNAELVRFLVEEVGVSVKVRDDWNKTALHELCWNSIRNNPAQFEAFQSFLDRAPELLFAKDRRGFFCLQYCPKDSWADWCRYLEQNKESLRCAAEVATASTTRKRSRDL
ncbi:ANK [Seminavis robusta]|uniref:ANK n=1 Tax=Seminavis robusta TaxID=568900 RepID=A0A9N8DFA2_9STRA|nr:ANK [Seminavis robusta]|eukprot:Sro113_g056030.1 ANK (380) ;mRNA; r:50703-51842